MLLRAFDHIEYHLRVASLLREHWARGRVTIDELQSAWATVPDEALARRLTRARAPALATLLLFVGPMCTAMPTKATLCR